MRRNCAFALRRRSARNDVEKRRIGADATKPTDAEAASLGPGRIVVECKFGEAGTVELALGEAALTGLLSWLEAAPPGSPWA